MPIKLNVTKSNPIVPLRAGHLDLNGVVPTFDHLLELLDVFRAGNYNALLIEWQGNFPWKFDKRLRNKGSYTPQQISAIYHAAIERELVPIPLVQCLGHMSNLLRFEEYAHLREVPHRFDTLNPLADGAREIVQTIIDEVLALMPDVKYFHLGGDEAWTFGTHPDTKAFIEKHSRAELYLHHYEPLLDKLAERQIRGLLWHDMMTDWDVCALKRLADKADLLVWGYDEHPDTTEGHWNTRYIERFDECGISMWGATAFKGADALDGDVPVKEKRLENAAAWAEVAQRFGFRGLVATGWSRFSCHSMQVEPLDGALDMLLLVGAILHDGELSEHTERDALNILDSLGQGENFRTCKAALEKLRDARCTTWNFQRWLEHQLAFGKIYPDRRGRAMEEVLVDFFEKTGRNIQAAAEQIRPALTGLIEPECLEEYIVSRVRAIDITRKEMIRRIDR